MADEGQPAQEESIEVLLEKVRRGAGAEGSTLYLGDLLWAKLWRSVQQLSMLQNPTLESLLDARAQIRSIMLLAQDLKLQRFEGKQAVEAVKKLYS